MFDVHINTDVSVVILAIRLVPGCTKLSAMSKHGVAVQHHSNYWLQMKQIPAALRWL